MTQDANAPPLQTTATSIEMLKALEERDGARISELADATDISKSTVHGHLKTLRQKQFVRKEGDIYYPGPELLRLGNYVRTSRSSYVLAREYTEQLFDRVNYRSIFVAEMSGRGVFIHTAAGDRSEWKHEQLGNQLYLHNTAVGKAILAEMPNRRVENILEKWGMPSETENTITDREELYEGLEEVREQGYAINRGENIEGLYAIGVAANDVSGEVVGAFSVSGPRRIVTDEEYVQNIVDELTKLVEEYELELALS
ncbi:IclR family transcriptional regulator [Halopiger xanaduensis]|uniref:Transcriptional regulator, IclR family n=1 Tax=Halopiger xanaduensis (strain DSM 18323 / JCM 14033 / SH-6) TaxID=797210 RepID=F8DD26_HALXS|nr:IclR family transcriptional regulator [Halopiger xanaduensis]AEH38913.1 transcriptional regulator, IclR family [Halopiger xanaduensis SH-6]